MNIFKVSIKIALLILLVGCNNSNTDIKEKLQIQSIEKAYELLMANLSYEVQMIHYDIRDDIRHVKSDSCMQLLFNSHIKIIEHLEKLNFNRKIDIENFIISLDNHMKLNEKIVNFIYNEESTAYQKINDYFNSEYKYFNLDSINLILNSINEDDKLFVSTLKLRLLEFDKMSISCLNSNLPDSGEFIDPKVDFIRMNDTIKVGQEYYGFAICGINISKYALEFKVDKVIDNGENLEIDFNIDTSKNYLTIKYKPKNIGKLIISGYGKYKNYKYGGIQYFPFSDTLVVIE